MALDTPTSLIISRHPSTGFAHRRVGNQLILEFPDRSVWGIIPRPSLLIGYAVWISGAVFPPSSNIAQYCPRRATIKFLRDGRRGLAIGLRKSLPHHRGNLSSIRASPPHPLRPDNPNPINREDVFANAIRCSKSRAHRKPPHADAFLAEPLAQFPFGWLGHPKLLGISGRFAHSPQTPIANAFRFVVIQWGESEHAMDSKTRSLTAHDWL